MPENVETELYTNLNVNAAYRYARPFETDVTYDSKQLTINGVDYVNVVITGIPDGVSPEANEAVIKRQTPRRLYILSDRPLDHADIEVIDGFYGKRSLPMPDSTTVCGKVVSDCPRNNFYSVEGTPNVAARFVEYRYVQRRHQPANIAWDTTTGNVHRLVLPPNAAMLVLVMPENFVRTSLKRGYFRLDNDLIVRVYSRFVLSAATLEPDNELISVINTDDARLMTVVRAFFARLGMHRIVSTAVNQIYAYDRYLTLVVGSISNVALP